MLKKEGISYIYIGSNSIALPAAMEILATEFGVKRMAVLGGGNINGGLPCVEKPHKTTASKHARL